MSAHTNLEAVREALRLINIDAGRGDIRRIEYHMDGNHRFVRWVSISQRGGFEESRAFRIRGNVLHALGRRRTLR